MNKRHVHADLIRAWAEGAEIELNIGDDWVRVSNPSWSAVAEYRIKPEKKPDVVRYALVEKDNWTACISSQGCAKDNMRVTFDGETGKLIKAEVL